MNKRPRTAYVIIATAFLAACSNSPKEPDYRASKSLPPLEVPPDLISPGKDQALNIPAPAKMPAPAAPVARRDAAAQTPAAAVGPAAPRGVQVRRDGAMRWLVVEAPPPQVWEDVKSFLKTQGMEIARDDSRLGILVTDWWQDPRTQDALKALLKKSFEDIERANLRNKYVFHIEPGATPGTTEVYVSHQGLEQVAYQDATRWQPRPSDPMLTREMIAKLVVHLGGAAEQADVPAAPAGEGVQAVSAADGAYVLNETFASAWRRVSIALDQAAFEVVDRHREAGYFLVRTDNAMGKGGWLRRFLSGGSEAQPMYRVVLVSNAQQTRMELHDENGKSVPARTADPLLQRLAEELRK